MVPIDSMPPLSSFPVPRRFFNRDVLLSLSGEVVRTSSPTSIVLPSVPDFPDIPVPIMEDDLVFAADFDVLLTQSWYLRNGPFPDASPFSHIGVGSVAIAIPQNIKDHQTAGGMGSGHLQSLRTETPLRALGDLWLVFLSLNPDGTVSIIGGFEAESIQAGFSIRPVETSTTGFQDLPGFNQNEFIVTYGSPSLEFSAFYLGAIEDAFQVNTFGPRLASQSDHQQLTVDFYVCYDKVIGTRGTWIRDGRGADPVQIPGIPTRKSYAFSLDPFIQYPVST